MTEATSGNDATGTNRFGETFTNSIPTPIQATNSCSWRPWTGTYTHQVDGRTATVVFGANDLGQPVGSESSCVAGAGYFVTYTTNSKTYTKFVEYWF